MFCSKELFDSANCKQGIMSRVSNMPRSSSSRYGLLDWMMSADNNHLILKCPSREDSLEFTERGVPRDGQSSIDTTTSTGRRCRPFVTGDNDGDDVQETGQSNHPQYTVVKNKLLAILLFVTVLCATLTGVAITGRRIDLSSMTRALKLTGGKSEEVVMVQTNCGRVIGTVNEGAFVFKVRSFNVSKGSFTPSIQQHNFPFFPMSNRLFRPRSLIHPQLPCLCIQISFKDIVQVMCRCVSRCSKMMIMTSNGEKRMVQDKKIT